MALESGRDGRRRGHGSREVAAAGSHGRAAAYAADLGKTVAAGGEQQRQNRGSVRCKLQRRLEVGEEVREKEIKEKKKENKKEKEKKRKKKKKRKR